MSKFLLVLTLATLSLAAADATGKWTGTITPQNVPGESEGKPAYLVLKQDGATLTGTAGPNADEQFAITGGKVEDGRLTFQLQEKSMSFDLKLQGDEITGDVTRDQDGEKQQAKLAVKRAN